MDKETGLVRREEAGLQTEGVEGRAIMVTPEYVENTVRSLSLLRSLVNEILVEGRDYGSVPGLPEFLWDPGASAIIASFNCHVGQRRILSFVNDGKRLSMVLEVPIIHNITQSEVGSGIGASTIAETKHKYRWERNPQDWGYTEGQIGKLETRERYDHTEYKILNPEPSDLLNTIIKMASKRAEVDAAEGLPGASSALKELLDPKLKKGYRPSNANKPTSRSDDSSPRWKDFWSQAAVLLGALAKEKGTEVRVLVHQMLGVKSAGDWLKTGKSLDDAIRVLAEKVAKPEESAAPRESRVIPERTEAEFQGTQDLLRICHEDFEMQPADVFKELGYPNQAVYEEAGITKPFQSYLQIKAVLREQQPDERVEEQPDLPF